MTTSLPILLFFSFILISMSIPSGWSMHPAANMPETFEIAIAIKRSDGGDIAVLKDLALKDDRENVILKAKKGESLNVEDVLKALYGLDVEYIKGEKAEDMGRKSSGKLRLNRYGKLSELDEQDIWTFMMGLGQTDSRWLLPGQREKPEHMLEPLFTGHAIVLLSHWVVDDQNPAEKKLEDVARFHFNGSGLNLFKAGKSFVVNQTTLEEEEITQSTGIVRRRGPYSKEAMEQRTKPLTIEAMKRIAIKLINGRPWKPYDGYTCMHFVYAFVLAIVADPHALMTARGQWPANLANLVDYAEAVDKIHPFEDILHRDEPFRRVVKLTTHAKNTDGPSK